MHEEPSQGHLALGDVLSPVSPSESDVELAPLVCTSRQPAGLEVSSEQTQDSEEHTQDSEEPQDGDLEAPPADEAALLEGKVAEPAVPRSSYRSDIDGLRALAVLSVVVYHLDRSWLPGGFVGVDIFFVISGFVVAGSLVRHTQSSASQYFVGFYNRRLKRLSPALVLMAVTICTLLAVLVNPNTPALPSYYQSGITSLVGFANIGFARMETPEDVSVAYFMDEEPRSVTSHTRGAWVLDYNPFTHCWSLAVEEQFYLIFPMLLFVSHPHRPLVLWFVFVLGIATSWFLSLQFPQLAFFLMPPRLWELLSGALLFLDVQPRWSNADLITRRWTWVLPGALEAISVLCLASSLFFTRNETNFPFPWALLAVVGTLTYIAAGARPRHVPLRLTPGHGRHTTVLHLPLLNWLLSRRIPVYIGLISYPIYLWHWPIIVLFRHTVGLRSIRSKATVVVITALAAAGTYHFVERPIQQWRLRRRQWRTSVVLLAALVVAGVWILLLRGPLGAHLYHGSPRPCAYWVPQRAPSHGIEFQTTGCSCNRDIGVPTLHHSAQSNATSNAPPCFDLEMIQKFPAHPDPMCFLAERDIGVGSRDVLMQRMECCLTPPNDQKPTYFLVGDSHAAMWLPALLAAVQNRVHVVLGAAGAGAGFEPVEARWFWGGRAGGADDFTAAVESGLRKSLRPNDVVFVASAFWKYLDLSRGQPLFRLQQNLSIYPHGPPNATALRAMQRFMTRVGRWVYEGGGTMVLFGDPPLMSEYPPWCQDHCPNVTLENASFPILDSALYNLSETVGRFLYWRSLPLFCADSACGPYIPGTSLVGYRDLDHLNTFGAVYTWPYLCDFLTNHGLLETG